MKGFTFTNIYIWRDLFMKGFFILKGSVLKELSKEGILSDSHSNSLYFAFQDDYSYQFFLDDQRIFLVNIDILLCVIGLTIPSSIQCIHVCCHVRTMQAKLEAIWCEAKEKCNCMYSFAACALYSSDSIHVVLFHSVLKMTTKSHILYWMSRQVLIT